ncbi:MAG TPA: HAD family hydrolase [Polyangiaceae bacterium]|jgi:phosphoglycolate phosphatase-like HAD superfamily hydrolase
MRRPTVVLFDIDGTLVTTAGAGRRAVNRTFDALYARPDACENMRFDGMTDRMIIRRGMDTIGIEPSEQAMNAWLEVYIAMLSDEIELLDTGALRAHAGMEAAVLAARGAGMAVGLGTGNVRAGARLKLERVGLFQQFAFGGFGCDAEPRADVIRIGAERGAASLAVPVADCRVVVIGDTPNDIAAAQAIGAECIGVGTGSFSAAALLERGASTAFPDFTAQGALEALLAP